MSSTRQRGRLQLEGDVPDSRDWRHDATLDARHPSPVDRGDRSVFFLAINFADKALMGLAAEPIMRELGLTHTQFGRIAASFSCCFRFRPCWSGCCRTA
jgi:hypothetical protein